MTLRLSSDQERGIRDHGQAAYPAEACGIFLGRMDESGFKVSRTVRMENTRRGETNYEFVIPADELLRVMKEARKEGLDIIGFYHSHPDHPARPSEKDKKWGGETWPGVAHLILAVAKGEPEEAKAFVFEPEAGAFREIQVHSASAAL